MNISDQNNLKLYIQHILVLLIGLLVGIMVSYGVSLLPISYGGDLVAARSLGIISLTVIEGYSKTRDIVNYFALVAISPGCAMIIWYFWVRGEKYERLCRIFGGPEPSGSVGNRCQLIAVFAAMLFLSFNINYFFSPIAGWMFHVEEGVNLFAASSIIGGGVYSLDFSSNYGPMLIYPLALLMKLIGATLLTDRIYTYFLNIVAYGIVTLFFFRTIRNRAVFVLASLLYLSVFHPFVAPSPNTSYLRVALGFLPLLFAGSYLESSARRHLWFCGIIAGQSLLFSQEVAICVLISLAATLFIRNLPEKSLRRFITEMLHVGGACLVSITPMLIYFAYKGALASFLFELVYYPKLFTMGFVALKFPSLTDLFTKPIVSQALYPYWLISIYLIAAIWLLPLLAMGRMGRRTMTSFAVLLMGIFLFRSALGRSDFYHFFYAAQPAFVLFFLLLDRAVCSGKYVSVPFAPWRRMIAVTFFALFYMIPFLILGYRQYIIGDFMKKGLDVSSKWTRRGEGVQLLVNRTGGVPLGEELVSSAAKIYNFLVRNTVQWEYVYFYPNEAGYYFLFDRRNPTRFPMSYQAVTTEQRREIIRDLEAKKPRYVVYSRRVWLQDNIQPEVQVPELNKYLADHYLPHEDMDEILIMKRIGL